MREILALVMLSGCSLLYDPDQLPTFGGSDAGTDSMGSSDGPPDAGFVDSIVEPLRIYEGQGIDNSRPAILTIQGTGFVAGAVTVTIAPTATGAMADLVLGSVNVAADGRSLAVPVVANIMPTVGNETAVPLTITIEQTGEPKITLAWTEVALDELTAITQLPPTQNRYSRVALAAAGTLPTGGPRVSIHSMSSISLAAFHADAMTTAPGAGGCAGGAPGLAGACPGAGGAGVKADANMPVASAGGGAGFSVRGGDGGANTGGPVVGDPFVASYAAPANVASGGGGGGSSALGTADGGAGGAGGGTLELHADGNLTTAALTALGGAGGAGAGGTGGGGAGGLLILRTGHTLAVSSVNVAGGTGGFAGNPGSAGRIRVDAPLGSITGAQIGPAFAISTPVVTTQSTLTVSIRTPSGVAFKLSRLDQHGALVELADVISGTGTADVAVPLVEGWNRLCVTVPGGAYADDIANECVELALIPN